MNLLIIVISFLGCYNETTRQEIANVKDIDKMKFIGEYYESTDKSYKVYNYFMKFEKANGLGANSYTIFISKTDTLIYQLDYLDDFADSISNNRICKNNKCEIIEISREQICMFNKCFNRVSSIQNINWNDIK